MPNRIIKESICTSEKIAGLSDFEFRLWIGLITQADDYGRGDARPPVIKGRIFPLRDRTTIKDIDVALQSLAAKGCVDLYNVDGKPYFLFPSWAAHQRIRDCKSKYPEPPCGELRQSAASCGELPPESNPNPNPNPIQSERGRFTPPTVDEVMAYCRERKNSVNAEQFVDFYSSKGWKVGKEPMKNWQACVRTWERREQKPVNPALDYSQKVYAEDELSHIIVRRGS
jgi:hypothetical protein